MMKRAATLALLLLLGACACGSRADFRDLMQTVFDVGFSCGRDWPERSRDQCWERYRDILK